MRAGVLAAGGILGACAVGVVGARALSQVGVHQGYAPEQPIAFSHRRHAGDNSIPCLYCHFAATRSRHAGIPAASVCLNCHDMLQVQTAEVQKLKEAVAQDRPIQWVKVHNLPDFVHFDHSQHLLAAVACRDCHGRVEAADRLRQDAPLTMGWCLECHRRRAPGLSVAAVGETRAHARGPAAGLDCGRCHH